MQLIGITIRFANRKAARLFEREMAEQGAYRSAVSGLVWWADESEDVELAFNVVYERMPAGSFSTEQRWTEVRP